MTSDGSLVGCTLSHYRIVAMLGAGGMGEVYRAEDTVLGREVAIKVLPAAFTSDPERLARFEREAKVLAALDHPNIAAIYALESSVVGHQLSARSEEPATEGEGGTENWKLTTDDRSGGRVHFLVMQLAEGETLAERISRGPLPVDEALPIASQIAQALECAHETGIIHRDLKPGNVKVDEEGHVRVLDFGLAKALDPKDPGSHDLEIHGPQDLSASPTLTAEMTAPGVVLGTAAYMSPEQARGKPADKRSDIWAFGGVLYEMLTGNRAFPGDTVTDSMAKILEREPDWDALPRVTPDSVRTLLRRCLAKDPHRRIHDMGDVWLELEEVPEAEVEQPIAPSAPIWRQIAPWVVAVLAIGVAVWALLRPYSRSAPTTANRFSLATRPLAVGPHPVSPIIALSPDGSVLAYVSGDQDEGMIVLRRLDSFEETILVDTRHAQAPFFSPDGDWLGYAAEGRLWKIRIDGGTATALAEVEVMHGASWGTDNTIVFSGAEGLMRVSADGGVAELVTREEREQRGEVGLHSPQLVVGGEKVIFNTVGPDGDPLEVALADLNTGERKTLIEAGGNARVLAVGYLAYAADNTLYVLRFDPTSAEVIGTPMPAISDLMMGFPFEPSLGHFTISQNGTLAYLSGSPVVGGARWVWVDRSGATQRSGEMQLQMFGPKFSPDGTRLAVAARARGQRSTQVWIEDLDRGTFSRLTFERENWWPLWSPDGRKIAFPSTEDPGTANVFWRFADGSGTAEQLTRGTVSEQPASWSPDGKELIFHRGRDPDTGWDVLALSLNGNSKPRPLLTSAFDELQPDLSPDGRWLAYVSNETGRSEVYVQRYPDLSGKWQISNEGGTEPAWSSSGDELFYRSGRQMMVVAMTVAQELRPGRPQMLFEGNFLQDVQYGRGYDVAPDDQGFVLIEQSSGVHSEYDLRVALNWLSEIDQLVTEPNGQ
jgi:serine/threonine-protein kinase